MGCAATMAIHSISGVLARKFSSSSSRAFISLKDTLVEQISKKKDRISRLRANYGNVKVGEITVGSILGGMRGNTSIYWQGTTLDPYKGIKFQGYTIEECQELLPKSMDTNSKNPNFLVESMLWLLMTGRIPSSLQVQSLVSELGIRGKKLPEFAARIIDNLPSTMHPMSQLAIGIASLNYISLFSKKYQEGTIGKSDYWHYIFEDTMTLVALLPNLVAKIYANSMNHGKPLGEFNSDRDWSYNLSSAFGMTFADSLNVENLNEQQCEDFTELVRLYCGIHADHEGGNVSAHTTHLVGSALSDPFLSYSSGVMGLAGPLHGLAAQEVVRFLKDIREAIDAPDSEEQIKNYIWNILHSHRVVPGYGHAVLRKSDPRFSAMVRFTKQRKEEFKNDEYVQLMINLSEYVPKILLEHGKIKNPYPNVDSASGIIFHHYGIKDLLFITVIFACSRAIGPLTQLVWDRILGLPIERPKSLDLQKLETACLANGSNKSFVH